MFEKVDSSFLTETRGACCFLLSFAISGVVGSGRHFQCDTTKSY